MYQTDRIVVQSTGTAAEALLYADYFVKVEMTGKTGVEAKEKAKPIIENIHSVIRAWKDKARIETNELKTRFDVEPNKVIDRTRSEMMMDGYRASFSIRFTGTNVQAAMELHDQLTSIEHVEAPCPEFRFHTEAAVKQAAFKQAVTAAKATFEAQCRVLELDPADFEIANWNTVEDQHQGKFLAYVDRGLERSSIEPGKASVTVKVQVIYRRKVR